MIRPPPRGLPADGSVLQAFGSNKVWHFDGSSWTQLIIGNVPMSDLWGSPTGELFAVGGEGTILRGP